MSGRRFALLAGLCFFVMFVASNLIANSWFRSWRLDLTENHLYSLSPGTGQVLDQLNEPVQLTFYYSRDAAADVPQVQTYAGRVREMLQSFAARSHGRVRFVEVNVKPFTEEEDKASEAGVEPRQRQEGGDPIYFGLVGANSINDTRAIPFFDPAQEPFLEYQITRLVYELENPELKHVALITSLPLDPAQASMAAMMGQQQSAFATELGRMAQVQKLPPDFSAIPGDTDVLVIIHPAPLTAMQEYAIDQFLLRKGRAFIALDPSSLMAQQAAGDPNNPGGAAPPSSNLQTLLSAWGVSLSPDVVLDLDDALGVPAQDQNGQQGQAPQPLFIHVPPAQLDQHDLMTSWLQRGVNFAASGSLNVSEREGLSATPLARTSGDTMHVPSEEVSAILQSPVQALQTWQSASRVETLALRLSGQLHTAFPNGPPEPPAAGVAAPPRLTASTGHAEIVVVADSDFIAADPFYVQNNNVIADNGNFALNAIDILSGSDALVSLRSRAPAARNMDLLDRMENQARQHIEQEQERLQGELQSTEAHLQELQAQGHGSGFFSGNLGAELTPAERQEIDRFRAQAMSVRGQLRGVQRNLRGDINNLEALIVFLDMWLAPLLVAAAGLFLFWRRQRRGQTRAAR
ncbi:MAG: GldG family protein [Alphaproteobacteria bacterium]